MLRATSMLLIPDVQSSLAASSSKQGNVVLLAAMKPVPHSSRRKFMPFANAVMAAQHAGWSMKVDLSNRLILIH